MTSLANYATTAVLTALAAYRLARSRVTGASPPVYLYGFLICLGLGLAMMAPASLRAVSHVEPVGNLARLVGNALEALAAASLTLFSYAIVSPDLARRRVPRVLTVLAAAVAAMLVLLIVADTRFTVNFVNEYSARAPIVAYEVVFFGFVGGCVVVIIRVLRWYARGCESRPLRLALRIIIAATTLSLVWTAWSGVRPLITYATGRELATTAPVGSVLGGLAVCSWLAGLTVMAWVSYLTWPVRWGRSYLAYRGLTGLWTALVTAAGVPTRGRTRPRWDAEYALWRRVIEIRDAQFALRGHPHPDVPEWTHQAARQLGVDMTPALAEAADLASAVEAARSGPPRWHPRPAGSGSQDRYRPEPSVRAEAEWLGRVGRAFTRSPVVRAVRERTRQAVAGTPGST